MIATITEVQIHCMDKRDVLHRYHRQVGKLLGVWPEYAAVQFPSDGRYEYHLFRPDMILPTGWRSD